MRQISFSQTTYFLLVKCSKPFQLAYEWLKTADEPQHL